MKIQPSSYFGLTWLYTNDSCSAGNLERRVDAAENDIKQIRGGMNYLVQQLSAPPDPPRKRIGFNSGNATKPYGKK